MERAADLDPHAAKQEYIPLPGAKSDPPRPKSLCPKGTLFGAWTIFSGAATKKGKNGATEQLRNAFHLARPKPSKGFPLGAQPEEARAADGADVQELPRAARKAGRAVLQ